MRTPPPNRFYTPFDQAEWGEARETDYRTPFQVDRDRIIHSPWLRKLQSKTQVFLSGEYDFYRTRLTHSIEVAQIGRSLCQYLRFSSPLLSEDFHLDADLVEAVCLAHDLGHPPFGHAGERALHELMRPYGGFEGNPQTLRLLSGLFYEKKGNHFVGMHPTRALLDGIMKYKRLFGESADAEHHFLYDEQVAERTFVLGDVALEPGPAGKAWNGLKSIECQVMDWADDTAYCLNDLIDGRKAGFLSREGVERWAEGSSLDGEQEQWLTRLIDKMQHGSLESYFGWKTGEFIKACSLVSDGAGEGRPPGNRHTFRLVIDPAVRREADLYKKLAFELIFRSPQLQQIEFKGTFMLQRLFTALWEHYQPGGVRRPLDFLPPSAGARLRAAPDERTRARIVADILSGLTDSAAIRMYKRLFDPDFASINDLVG